MKSYKGGNIKKVKSQEQDNLINLYNKLGLDPPQSQAVQTKKKAGSYRRRGALIEYLQPRAFIPIGLAPMKYACSTELKHWVPVRGLK